MSTVELTHNVEAEKTTSVSVISKALSKIGLGILRLAAAITPQPNKIEVRMSDGYVLTNIPARVWDRHSALISARYEAERRNKS